MTDGATGTMPARRAQMLPYALWQARDYLIERGLPTMIVAGLVGFLGALPILAVKHDTSPALAINLIRQYGSVTAGRHAMLLDASLAFLSRIAGPIVFVGALLAMSGLVSNDRKNGYYRFLFSKPVSPHRYYGQAFVIHAIGFLFAIILLGLLWGAAIVPVLSVDLLLAMFIVYLCYAGIAFLLSAAAKWDWLSLVAVAIASTVLWDKFGDSPSPAAKLLWLLPPLTKVDPIYSVAANHLGLPWRLLGWLAGYGVACFIGGLVVLHHRRLATP